MYIKSVLIHLIDPSFHGVNRLFALSFENENGITSRSEHYLAKVERKGHNVKIDDKNNFDHSVKINKITYGNINKIATGHGDNWPTLVYPHFKKYKMIAIDLSKQQSLDADPRLIQ